MNEYHSPLLEIASLITIIIVCDSIGRVQAQSALGNRDCDIDTEVAVISKQLS